MKLKIFKIFLILFTCTCFSVHAASKFTYNILNVSAGLNVGYLKSSTTEIKKEIFPFSAVNLELIRVTKLPLAFSIENSNFFGLDTHEFLNRNLHNVTVNIGFMREFESNLSYKSGLRSVTILLGGGLSAGDFGELVSNKEKRRYPIANLQVLFRYMPSDYVSIYEPIFNRINLTIVKVDTGSYLYSLGFNISFDILSYIFKR